VAASFRIRCLRCSFDFNFANRLGFLILLLIVLILIWLRIIWIGHLLILGEIRLLGAWTILLVGILLIRRIIHWLLHRLRKLLIDDLRWLNYWLLKLL